MACGWKSGICFLAMLGVVGTQKEAQHLKVDPKAHGAREALQFAVKDYNTKQKNSFKLKEVTESYVKIGDSLRYVFKVKMTGTSAGKRKVDTCTFEVWSTPVTVDRHMIKSECK